MFKKKCKTEKSPLTDNRNKKKGFFSDLKPACFASNNAYELTDDEQKAKDETLGKLLDRVGL